MIETIYSNPKLNNELYHHGIKGQQWGKRNGPPYPLSNSQKSNAEKENEGKSNKTRQFVKAKGAIPAEVISASIELTVTGIAFIVGAIMKKKRNNEFDELTKKAQSKGQTIDDLPRMKESMPTEESMKVVNPGYSESKPEKGTTENCTFCTAAMVLREKGYDVVAKKSQDGWYPEHIYKKAFEGSKIKQIPFLFNASKAIFKSLNKQEDGAYGYLGVTWAVGGGHAIFWKKENGSVRIYDSQSGEEYESDHKIWGAVINAQYSRLDNCKINDDVLAMVEGRKEVE